MKKLVLLATVGLLCACSSSTPAPGLADASVTTMDMAVVSACGHPGDKGNSLGVGKYCQTPMDCSGLTASICSSIENGTPGLPNTFVCTLPCQAGSTTTCGENASCQCMHSGACGCVPDSCPVPDGGV